MRLLCSRAKLTALNLNRNGWFNFQSEMNSFNCAIIIPFTEDHLKIMKSDVTINIFESIDKSAIQKGYQIALIQLLSIQDFILSIPELPIFGIFVVFFFSLRATCTIFSKFIFMNMCPLLTVVTLNILYPFHSYFLIFLF